MKYTRGGKWLVGNMVPYLLFSAFGIYQLVINNDRSWIDWHPLVMAVTVAVAMTPLWHTRLGNYIFEKKK